MARPKKTVTVASVRDDGSVEFVEAGELGLRREKLASKVEPLREPETLHEAMRDLSLSERWGSKPSSRAAKIILAQYGRENMPLIRHNKSAADKRARWQEWAAVYWARHPNSGCSATARVIKARHRIAESVGYIAKRIAKPK